MPVGVLIDHATDIVRIEAGEHAVHDNLRDRDLPGHRLAARLEIDRVGKAAFRLGIRFSVKVQEFGRRRRRRAGRGPRQRHRFGRERGRHWQRHRRDRRQVNGRGVGFGEDDRRRRHGRRHIWRAGRLLHRDFDGVEPARGGKRLDRRIVIRTRRRGGIEAGDLGDGRRRRQCNRDALDSFANDVRQIGDAMTVCLDRVGCVPHRANVGQIERGQHHRADCESDADAFGAAINLFLDRQLKRIDDIDTARQHIQLPVKRTRIFLIGRRRYYRGVARARALQKLFE